MSIKCETQACKKRLSAGITATLVVLAIAIAGVIQITQVATPLLTSPTPF